jgi:predicted dehydrogenase
VEEERNPNGLSRRDMLKGLITLPVLGYFANRFYVKHKSDFTQHRDRQSVFGISETTFNPVVNMAVTGERLRVGIVGYGMRGTEILRGMGYADNEWAENNMTGGKPNPVLQSFFAQDNLHIEITGVCDTFSLRAEMAQATAATKCRAGNAPQQKTPEIYPTYREMLEDNNLDAIVILTPDHWHAQIAADAALAGKHVYLEKPMCRTAEEAKMLRKIVKETGIVLQVGHQNRQQASYIKAKEIVDKNILGNISMVETFTNRNNDHGAWIRDIPGRANESNVNWKEFLGNSEWREFDPDRYFNWQKWFEYGTGPAGNQFTHEYDCVNQVLDLGIPERVTAVGSLYYFKDRRDIPDLFNAVFEYASKGLSLTYDCTLRNSKLRDKTFLGSDASMEVNVGVVVYPDRQSEKYKKYNPAEDEPLFHYHPRSNIVDATTSATSKYYHERGFGYTYHNGERIDTTYLHIKEWLQCIRNGTKPSCCVDKGFEETVTFYMSNLAYLEKRVVEWDPVRETIK